MKKVILPLLTALISFSAIAAIDKSLPYEVIGIYDRSGYDIPNYYIILSDNEQAYYNHKTAAMEISSGYVLTLDLYNVASDPVALQPGTYTARKHSDAYAPLQFDVAYSEVTYYQDGKAQSRQSITEPVVIELAESGLYSITVQAKDPVSKEDCRFVFSGRVPLTDSNEKPASFPMLKHDVEYELGGGIAFYQGVSDLSNQGVTYLNLYQGEYDSNGGLTGDGVNLAMMIAHKRIAKPADYRVIPGTYTAALTLARDTWYPCREINYPVGNETISLPFGSFIRIRSNDTFVYGYLKSGTFVLEVDDNGIASGTLDATTDMGYSVKATFRGSVALNTDNATFKSAVSDLTDDVEMDFSKLDKGRVWHTGLKGGCRTFVVDLGSPAGRDEAINHGGDLLRMEFLSPASDAVIKPGVYTVVTRRWNDYELNAGGTYEPMSLNKGYFGNSGDQTGTRYAHFRNGSYCVYDMVGPAEEGTVTVSTDDYVNYTFDINLIDDAGYIMAGRWDNKPIEYFYDREALEKELGTGGISEAVGDSGIKVVVEGKTLVVLNGGDAPFTLVDLNGRTVATGRATEALDISDLYSNIYILFINNQSFKVVL